LELLRQKKISTTKMNFYENDDYRIIYVVYAKRKKLCR
jgi:hypothetical protein